MDKNIIKLYISGIVLFADSCKITGFSQAGARFQQNRNPPKAIFFIRCFFKNTSRIRFRSLQKLYEKPVKKLVFWMKFCEKILAETKLTKWRQKTKDNSSKGVENGGCAVTLWPTLDPLLIYVTASSQMDIKKWRIIPFKGSERGDALTHFGSLLTYGHQKMKDTRCQGIEKRTP